MSFWLREEAGGGVHQCCLATSAWREAGPLAEDMGDTKHVWGFSSISIRVPMIAKQHPLQELSEVAATVTRHAGRSEIPLPANRRDQSSRRPINLVTCVQLQAGGRDLTATSEYPAGLGLKVGAFEALEPLDRLSRWVSCFTPERPWACCCFGFICLEESGSRAARPFRSWLDF